ncbi:hypothetical protein CONPUDRAFT_56042 [Coniophora puteana RWD-64-598 SS2]|uniref:RING-type domain-containing protein n=1 Tax=Coniophora puteana (strain RWD-64-598) TaxID=741705 RepID=A0A5M3MP86_CONPW|nr:uncharacterized protein CONPUDRAFT_56042 [Coniophora puteana RWD-64-598 SS2]EIW80992.1 hypothetical protein CONPUDRAFT_56042 [Coniophora puteana RWD-64-598 SS2]
MALPPATYASVASSSFVIQAGHTSTIGVKRGASPSFDASNSDGSRKRLREDSDAGYASTSSAANITNYQALAEDIIQELQCGCCSELVYRPVVVSPCQHFFCGSCVFLWIKNGGTSCPACRAQASLVTPSRPLQSLVDIILRADPSRTRAEGERRQADEVYKQGSIMRIPTPREPSPEPNLNPNLDYVRPCPHCSPNNQFGWSCPEPVVDYAVDAEHAWHLDDGSPPGHAYCGNCENLLALLAPSTTKCDFCQVSFCGVNVPDRCIAAPLLAQRPHSMNDIGDLILSADMYDNFNGNNVEVDIMIDYLTNNHISPRRIYHEIIIHLQSQPGSFKIMIDSGLFLDVHSVAPGRDEDPDATRSKICRLCAAEILIQGMKDWWIREREKGALDPDVARRPDCAEGSSCPKQRDLGPHGSVSPPSLLTVNYSSSYEAVYVSAWTSYCRFH